MTGSFKVKTFNLKEDFEVEVKISYFLHDIIIENYIYMRTKQLLMKLIYDQECTNVH